MSNYVALNNLRRRAAWDVNGWQIRGRAHIALPPGDGHAYTAFGRAGVIPCDQIVVDAELGHTEGTCARQPVFTDTSAVVHGGVIAAMTNRPAHDTLFSARRSQRR